MGKTSFDDKIKEGKAKLKGNRKPYDELENMLTTFTMAFELLPGTLPDAATAPGNENPFKQKAPADSSGGWGIPNSSAANFRQVTNGFSGRRKAAAEPGVDLNRCAVAKNPRSLLPISTPNYNWDHIFPTPLLVITQGEEWWHPYARNQPNLLI